MGVGLVRLNIAVRVSLLENLRMRTWMPFRRVGEPTELQRSERCCEDMHKRLNTAFQHHFIFNGVAFEEYVFVIAL